MNTAVHTSTAQQPYFAFFAQPAPCMVDNKLPTVDGEESDLLLLHVEGREDPLDPMSPGGVP
ncbi:hypothetical protein E2C01_067571 [Portunus trituberculatus]|uniref:Uncharacterized protein n=1 Tax=Portunus trituberculatus TaxID=210409 RepID=A0A5B7HTZ7_PORTR|nr:hypothetical protein [Portunus trituberculatus]